MDDFEDDDFLAEHLRVGGGFGRGVVIDAMAERFGESV